MPPVLRYLLSLQMSSPLLCKKRRMSAYADKLEVPSEPTTVSAFFLETSKWVGRIVGGEVRLSLNLSVPHYRLLKLFCIPRKCQKTVK
jgi:hypothetical protein